MSKRQWADLNERIVACDKCSRLRQHCQQIATQKRRAYASDQYWGQPVENFGDSRARLLIIGLAPAAHGANRTGRMFTGDRSGDWLYGALHRAGFANQSVSRSRHDTLQLKDCAITAVCHCAPPGNRPTAEELANCADWLHDIFSLTPSSVFLALGQIAFRATIDELRRRDWIHGQRPRFGHGVKVELAGERWLLASYHPSQQNTFTGRLTREMLDDVLRSVRELL
jgi:uracil-DNA glycosylase family 4